MQDFDPKSVMEGLKPIADQAGDMVRKAAGETRHIRHKGRIDLVTETDLAVETMLKEKLPALVPGADFLAEETDKETEPGEFTWIIDPVDGTTNFAHGLPMVANSIALWHRDRVILGVVNLPLMGEMFTAVEGQGAFMNGAPIAVSRHDDLEQCLIATGFPYDIEAYFDEVMAQLRRVLPVAQGLRRPGAAALDLAYVACGRYDGFYESALNPWDVAAGLLLIKEAGGRVSRYDASREYGFDSKSILATNGAIHEALSDLLISD